MRTKKPTPASSPKPPLSVQRAVALLRDWGVSPEMREAGATAVSSARNELFGNGSVGFHHAETIAVVAYEAMIAALMAGQETLVPSSAIGRNGKVKPNRQ